MLDTNETMLSLPDAIAHFPLAPHITTLYRWCERGVRGVKLETMKSGGRTLTSVEAIRRFLAAQNGEAPLTLSKPQRQRLAANAQSELKRRGL